MPVVVIADGGLSTTVFELSRYALLVVAMIFVDGVGLLAQLFDGLLELHKGLRRLLLQRSGQRHQRIVLLLLLLLRQGQMLVIDQRIEQFVQQIHIGHDERVYALQIERRIQSSDQVHLKVIHFLRGHVLAAGRVLIVATAAAVVAADEGRGMKVLHADGIH